MQTYKQQEDYKLLKENAELWKENAEMWKSRFETLGIKYNNLKKKPEEEPTKKKQKTEQKIEEKKKENVRNAKNYSKELITLHVERKNNTFFFQCVRLTISVTIFSSVGKGLEKIFPSDI